MEKSPLQPTPVGAFRFNTESSKLEYYDGNQWVNIISYVTISTLGNAIDFGDMTHTPEQTSALSDSNGGLG